jgi:type IV pilus assembly protein PilB
MINKSEQSKYGVILEEGESNRSSEVLEAYDTQVILESETLEITVNAKEHHTQSISKQQTPKSSRSTKKQRREKRKEKRKEKRRERLKTQTSKVQDELVAEQLSIKKDTIETNMIKNSNSERTTIDSDSAPENEPIQGISTHVAVTEITADFTTDLADPMRKVDKEAAEELVKESTKIKITARQNIKKVSIQLGNLPVQDSQPFSQENQQFSKETQEFFQDSQEFFQNAQSDHHYIQQEPQHDLEVPQHDLEVPQSDLEVPQSDLEVPQSDLEVPQSDLEVPQNTQPSSQNTQSISQNTQSAPLKAQTNSQKNSSSHKSKIILSQEEHETKPRSTSDYVLMHRNFDQDEKILEMLSQRYNLPSVNLKDFKVEADALTFVPASLCQKYTIIPISIAGSSLVVAMMKPNDLNAIDDLRFCTNLQIEPVVATESAINYAINRHYELNQVSYEDIIEDIDESEVDYHRKDEPTPLIALEAASGEPPVVRLCNAILINAIKRKASDVHIECFEKEIRIRYRIDGVLQKEMNPPLSLKSAIVSRFKIMASMDIAERRLPQDGRIKLHLGQDRKMDFRVSSIPTFWGEKIVLRLLDQSNLELDMTKLGFDEDVLQTFKNAVKQPSGLVLVTGPTGSGKTTTLYSALSDLNTMDTNVSTAEDPIEYDLPGINQVQMHEDIGLNFATALRAFLRQDPDVIMVGEIRDFETAEMAVKASLTGHLVLSTLHTNDSPSTISRLLDMGIEPYLITSSLSLVVAQRLARRICSHCAMIDPVDPQDLIDMGVPSHQSESMTVYQGFGCHQCHDTGYKGRVALYEVMPLSPSIKKIILQGGSVEEIKATMMASGVQTLRQAGLQKLREGVTSVKEVLRVTRADELIN